MPGSSGLPSTNADALEIDLMTDRAELAKELDRLITQGHQDSSLSSSLLKKFPEATEAEIEAGLFEVAATRRLNMKDRLAVDGTPTR